MASKPGRPALTTRDKYRVAPRPKAPISADEIRITSDGRLPRYVTYAARLFTEQNKKSVTIKATGNAISGAITVAEIIKRRLANIHQVNAIGVNTISDTYEPLEEGLDEIVRDRDVPFLEITLTVDPETIDKNAVGYQEPIDQIHVKAMTVQDIVAPRGGRGGRRGAFQGSYSRGRGGGRGRGRGRGRGTFSQEGNNNPVYPSRGPYRNRGGYRSGRGGYRGRVYTQTTPAEGAAPS